MRHPLLLPFVLACAAASPASAQAIVFAGLPWGTAGDAVDARAAAEGFTLDGREDGDHIYRRADGAWLKAYLRAGRAIGITYIDPARRPAVDARFRALVDSLEARLGAPAVRDPDEVRWEAGLAQVSVKIEFVRGPQVEVRWVGPGWFDEMHRRRRLLDLPPLPAGYTIVSANPFSYVSVDTTSLARQAGGVLRARFRIDYPQPVGPETDAYDAAEYEMELDCAGRRTRLLHRTTFLAGARRHDDVYQRIPWAVPEPGNHHARGLSAVCRAASR
jgi:hypothetical protein